MALFGAVTSEERYRKQHFSFMEQHRLTVKEKNVRLEAAAREIVEKNKLAHSSKFQWLEKAWSK